jgi:hypothetical protein
MSVIEIGSELVRLCNEGKDHEAVDRFYDEKIVSIEGQGSDEMPARIEGLEAVRGKSAWWYDNHEVHSTAAEGPFVGHRDDRFAVVFGRAQPDARGRPLHRRRRQDRAGGVPVPDGLAAAAHPAYGSKSPKLQTLPSGSRQVYPLPP